MCKVTGYSSCRCCIFNYTPGAFDGVCMIPDEYRKNQRKAVIYMKDNIEMLDETRESVKRWIVNEGIRLDHRR